MFVGFIGAPNSGKTTIAAKVFADLKQVGQPNVEFIVEEARRYIAEKKNEEETVTLTDMDQVAIFNRQVTSEYIMHTAVGQNGLVISDSCALNAFWYMSEATRQRVQEENREYYKWLIDNASLFYCPIVGIHTNDNLRIHNVNDSKQIDQEALKFIVTNTWLPLKAQLRGSIDFRVSKVLETIYERLT